MTKITKAVLVGLVLLAPVLVFAETDYKAKPIIRDIQKGVKNQNAIENLYVRDSLEVDGSADFAGNLVVSGALRAVNGLSTVGVAYTPATMGGTTNSPISLGITIPAGSVIRDGYVYTYTAVRDADQSAAATISIGMQQDSYAGLYAAATNLIRATGLHQLIPDYATVGDAQIVASNQIVYVKTSVGALTNGVFYIFLKYDRLP